MTLKQQDMTTTSNKNYNDSNILRKSYHRSDRTIIVFFYLDAIKPKVNQGFNQNKK